MYQLCALVQAHHFSKPLSISPPAKEAMRALVIEGGDLKHMELLYLLGAAGTK